MTGKVDRDYQLELLQQAKEANVRQCLFYLCKTQHPCLYAFASAEHRDMPFWLAHTMRRIVVMC